MVLEESLIERVNDNLYKISPGFVPNMKVPGYFYVNQKLSPLVFDEVSAYRKNDSGGGFTPAVVQIANVASLPGVIGRSIGLPDIHSGYGFAIGNVAAMDMSDPEAVVSPGGVGFDINCGVRLIRTNLFYEDIKDKKEELVEELFNTIPVGVGSKGKVLTNQKTIKAVMKDGVKWCLENGDAWDEDLEMCEEGGCMKQADPSKVSDRASRRGIPQLGTLGAGNHYAEIQIVEEIYDKKAADQMGIGEVGQVCVMIHSGSRGLGHQVATDYLQEMEKSLEGRKMKLNDRQLACSPILSQEGQDYLGAMACAANYAWVNRQMMTSMTRKAFAKVFNTTADDLEMKLVYDVSHNIAKIERHSDPSTGKPVQVLVHRKGATRAFGPGHESIPLAYQDIGQPVLVGGTMGTCSFVLTGTEEGMKQTFGSTCHGAGRAKSRSEAKKMIPFEQVLENLRNRNISFRVASPKAIAEEAPESYKDVVEVVDTCHSAGISKKAVKLCPVAVIKG